MIDLSLLMPELADKIREFVLEAQYQGLDCDIESAFRSIKDQNFLYSLGRTVKNPDGASPAHPLGNIVTNARGGYSWHNWGVAADVVFRKNGLWDWNATPQQYQQLAEMAPKFGLTWGGSWTGNAKSLGDLDHFEYTNGLTIHQAVEIDDIKRVWEVIRSGNS